MRARAETSSRPFFRCVRTSADRTPRANVLPKRRRRLGRQARTRQLPFPRRRKTAIARAVCAGGIGKLPEPMVVCSVNAAAWRLPELSEE